MEWKTIFKLFATGYYLVPDYQRDYEWTNAENTTLSDDIFDLLNGDIPAEKTHFIGAVVSIPYEEGNGRTKSINLDAYSINTSNAKHIVDGQQRLISLSLFVAALKKAINEDEDIQMQNRLNLSDKLDVALKGRDFNDQDKPAPSLILNANSGDFYNNEILGISSANYNRKLKGANRMRKAFALFLSEINSHRNSTMEVRNWTALKFYKKLISIIFDKIVFVEIECDASSNAFQVFDSLNGKGLDLTAADRIKNIAMSWIPSGEGARKWDALQKEIGDDYVTNFFSSLFFYNSEKRVSKNKLPDEFKDTYASIATDNFDSFYENLKRDGKLYGSLRKQSVKDDDLKEMLLDLEQLRFEQIYTLIFAAAKHYDIDLVNDSSDSYNALTKSLTSLVVRMQICEKNMNKLDTFFSDCIKLMKSNKPIEDVIKKINDEILRSVPDNVFESSFKSFAPNDSKVAEFYLRHIERELRKEAGNRNPVVRSLTVEHIIPQTLDELSDWYGEEDIPEEIEEDFSEMVVDNIGNKLLLYGDDNTSASNNDYAHKITIYREGKRGQDEGAPINTFELVKELLNDFPDKFNHEEVIKRAEKMAKIASKIWK